MLIGIDHRSSERVAIPTRDRRANNVETIESIIQALQRMGHHGPLELRTDGEPSLVELMRNVAEKRGAIPFYRGALRMTVNRMDA